LRDQKGNALFLILIAVALFAALSYAVTQSGRSGGGVDKEKLILQASQVIDYVGQVEQTISRMRLINGCADTDISFENPITAGYTNATSPADKSCHVFDPEGGGLSYNAPNSAWFDLTHSAEARYQEWFFTGRPMIWSQGTDASELMIALPYITLELCQELNKKLGTSIPPTLENDGPYDLTIPFVGAYVPSGPGPDANDGEYTNCVEGDGTTFLTAGGYHFYHILIAR